jgi:hypothetical protein
VAKNVVFCVFSRSVLDIREQKKRKKARFALSAIVSLSDGGSPASKDSEQALRLKFPLFLEKNWHKDESDQRDVIFLLC